MDEDYNILKVGKDVLKLSAESITATQKKLDESFCKAVSILHETKGNIILSGIGKSGIIAKKIAATLSSTGTFSCYVHPGDAFHGDFGMIKPKDTLLVFSHSGETEELLKFLGVVKKLYGNNKIIAVTANGNSALAHIADVAVLTYVTKESLDEDFQFIPTTSTTVTLAVGDALAIALQKIKGFKITHFLTSHPGGNVGNHSKKILDSK